MATQGRQEEQHGEAEGLAVFGPEMLRHRSSSGIHQLMPRESSAASTMRRFARPGSF